MLFVARCPLCRALGAAPCTPCRALLEPAGPISVAGADAAAAVFAYAGAARSLVLALKYGNERASVGFLAAELAAVAPRPAERPLVTWVPTTRGRRAQRGFDQAELLARALARRLRAPARATLRRLGTLPQTGRGAAERAHGPQFVVQRSVAGARVLVVDDVVTSGATSAAAVAALRAAGADRVEVRAVAATPRRVIGSNHLVKMGRPDDTFCAP